MTSHGDWSSLANILCVRLDNMGDVLMSTPAIRALRVQNPHRSITLLASPGGARLAPHLSDVDKVIAHAVGWMKHSEPNYQRDAELIARLAAQHFDAAIIFTVYSQSALPAALVCYLAGIPKVLAYARENPYGIINHWVRETEPDTQVRHEVQRQLDLVKTVGASPDRFTLAFSTRDNDRRRLHTVLRDHNVRPEGGWIVAHCGASAPSRRYKASRFSSVLAAVQKSGRPVLLTGTGDERHRLNDIIARSGQGAGLINLAGKLTLGELGCLIEGADLLIANNTGPVHIAAALQTPVVDLYALTNPQHTPWRVPHRVLFHDVPCRYCYSSVCPHGHNACLTGVEPQDVVDAAMALLRKSPKRAATAA